MRREIERWHPGQALAGDWPMYRGNLQRSQLGKSDAPLLEPVWQVSTTTTEPGRRWLADASRRLGPAAPMFDPNTGLPVSWMTHAASGLDPANLPAGMPLSIGGKLLFRTHAGIQAVDNQTGRPLWHARLGLSLESILADPARKVQLDRWLGMYGGLYPNSTQGTLSSDGRLVFAVDDLPLPPHPSHIMEMQAGKKHYFSTLRDAIYHNRLVALDAETGAVAWEAGGRTGNVPAELVDAWFLGPPLPLGNSVYALVEKKQDLSLVCLGCSRGELQWSLPLATAPTSLLLDVSRRVHAVHLAYHDGLLICSTHAGVVVAVNVLSRSLTWAHEYPPLVREENPEAPEGLVPVPPQEGLKGCAPLIAHDRVVISSPDSDAVRCLQLSDGVLLWKAELAEEDLYVGAVTPEKVLVVGRHGCRALSLANGKTVWEHSTPRPSGQGTLCRGPGGDMVYYLPLQSGDVLALNMDKPGASVQQHRHGSAALGNLVLQDGHLWSQTATAVTAFPPLRQRLARVEEQLKASPAIRSCSASAAATTWTAAPGPWPWPTCARPAGCCRCRPAPRPALPCATGSGRNCSTPSRSSCALISRPARHTWRSIVRCVQCRFPREHQRRRGPSYGKKSAAARSAG